MRVWIGAAIALVSCAKTTVPSSRAPNLEIVQIDVKRGGEVSLLKAGDVLQSEDEIAVFFELDQSAYVYVIRSSKRDIGSALYPTNTKLLQTPAGRAQVPEAGSFLLLHDLKPDELVCVAASAEPLVVMPSCATSTPIFEERGETQPPPPPPPPPDKTDAQRGKDKIKTLRLPLAKKR